jgi:hypothetical protein
VKRVKPAVEERGADQLADPIHGEMYGKLRRPAFAHGFHRDYAPPMMALATVEPEIRGRRSRGLHPEALGRSWAVLGIGLFIARH